MEKKLLTRGSKLSSKCQVRKDEGRGHAFSIGGNEETTKGDSQALVGDVSEGAPSALSHQDQGGSH